MNNSNTPKRRKTRSPSRTPQDQELSTETEPHCAIPVLPRFQADLPDLTYNRKDPDSEKFLGKQIWPPLESEETSNDVAQLQQDNNEDVIGKGRPENCSCLSPGSVECVNHHIAEKRNKLKAELGPAFSAWGFDTMGEDVSEEWSTREEKKFEANVKKIMPSKDKKSNESSASIRGKDDKSLVSYYFNVHTPRRIGKQTRSGITEIDTDDDVPRKRDGSSYSSSKKVITKSVTNNVDPIDDNGNSGKPKRDKSNGNSGNDKYLSGYR